MDAITFIADSLAQVQLRLLGTCDGLTQEQALWRPAPHANNIGFILWHVARGEDNMAASLQGGAALWEKEGWYERFGQPVEMPDPGDRMGLRALAIPSVETLMGYLDAVHRQTGEYLSTLRPERLDDAAEDFRPGATIGECLRHLITHKNNHHGQVDFLRGLQDDAWDLPPGTGMKLPGRG